VLFYNLPYFLQHPLEMFQLWNGGMSFHGGFLGCVAAVLLFGWKRNIPVLSLGDVTCAVGPIGLLLGRLANFINGELWGRAADPSLPWAMVFPHGGPLPRHPSQLYEAGLEGVVTFLVLAFLFWRTDARYKPGFLFGMAAILYGLSRFALEFVREPDVQLGTLPWGLTMGQTLTVPMLIAGIWLVATARGRRQRVEPIAGPDSIA
jgi:phosphatidylglycerol:prolipoprotein diacylglycerol transferase